VLVESIEQQEIFPIHNIGIIFSSRRLSGQKLLNNSHPVLEAFEKTQ
jgi:hypothetical protein